MRTIPTVNRVELHLSTSHDLPAKYGKKIKAVGGKYSDVRGTTMTRYVELPATEVDLINTLVMNYRTKKTAMLARNVDFPVELPSWAMVFYFVLGEARTPMEFFTESFTMKFTNYYERLGGAEAEKRVLRDRQISALTGDRLAAETVQQQEAQQVLDAAKKLIRQQISFEEFATLVGKLEVAEEAVTAVKAQIKAA